MAALTEFIQDGIRYVPTKVVAKSVGLAPDYLSRFCREGLVAGVFHKGAWYVEEQSLNRFLADQERQREEYNRKLSDEAKQEVARVRSAVTIAPHPHLREHRAAHQTPTLQSPASPVLPLLTFCILIGTGVAFEAIAPPNSIARASLKNNFAMRATQLAAASSLPWFDALADNFYNALCPIFRNCTASAPTRISQQPSVNTSPPAAARDCNINAATDACRSSANGSANDRAAADR